VIASTTRTSTELSDLELRDTSSPSQHLPSRHAAKWRWAIKRGFDILAAGGMLALTLPLLTLAAVAIRLETRGPILFRQERVGLHGRIFTLAKLRTIRHEPPAEGRHSWARELDPRIARVGAVLRRHRIDELPQLINVLGGEMSLVGPRPEVPHYVERLAGELPDYHLRHAVKPGLTGLVQVRARQGIPESRRSIGGGFRLM